MQVFKGLDSLKGFHIMEKSLFFLLSMEGERLCKSAGGMDA